MMKDSKTMILLPTMIWSQGVSGSEDPTAKSYSRHQNPLQPNPEPDFDDSMNIPMSEALKLVQFSSNLPFAIKFDWR